MQRDRPRIPQRREPEDDRADPSSDTRSRMSFERRATNKRAGKIRVRTIPWQRLARQSSCGDDHRIEPCGRCVRAGQLPAAQRGLSRARSARRRRADVGRERADSRGHIPPAGRNREDGSADYFELVEQAGGPEKLGAEFARRVACWWSVDDLDDVWRSYLSGVFAVCLRSRLGHP